MYLQKIRTRQTEIGIEKGAAMRDGQADIQFFENAIDIIFPMLKLQ